MTGVGSSRLNRGEGTDNKTEDQIKAEILSISRDVHQLLHSQSSSQGGQGLGLGQGIGSSSSTHILSQSSRTGVNTSSSSGSQDDGFATQDPNLHSQSVLSNGQSSSSSSAEMVVTSSTASHTFNDNDDDDHDDNDDDHTGYGLSQDDDFSRHSEYGAGGYGRSYQDIGCSQESNLSCVSALGATDPMLEEGRSMSIILSSIHSGFGRLLLWTYQYQCILVNVNDTPCRQNTTVSSSQ